MPQIPLSQVVDPEDIELAKRINAISQYNANNGRRNLGKTTGGKPFWLGANAAQAFELAMGEAKRRGINIQVNSGGRELAEQARLYNQLKGKQAVAPPSPNAPHVKGLAIDVQNYAQARPILEQYGFKWANHKNDPWHFDFQPGPSPKQVPLPAKQPENNDATIPRPQRSPLPAIASPSTLGSLVFFDEQGHPHFNPRQDLGELGRQIIENASKYTADLREYHRATAERAYQDSQKLMESDLQNVDPADRDTASNIIQRAIAWSKADKQNPTPKPKEPQSFLDSALGFLGNLGNQAMDAAKTQTETINRNIQKGDLGRIAYDASILPLAAGAIEEGGKLFNGLTSLPADLTSLVTGEKYSSTIPKIPMGDLEKLNAELPISRFVGQMATYGLGEGAVAGALGKVAPKVLELATAGPIQRILSAGGVNALEGYIADPGDVGDRNAARAENAIVSGLAGGGLQGIGELGAKALNDIQVNRAMSEGPVLDTQFGMTRTTKPIDMQPETGIERITTPTLLPDDGYTPRRDPLLEADIQTNRAEAEAATRAMVEEQNRPRELADAFQRRIDSTGEDNTGNTLELGGARPAETVDITQPGVGKPASELLGPMGRELGQTIEDVQGPVDRELANILGGYQPRLEPIDNGLTVATRGARELNDVELFGPNGQALQRELGTPDLPTTPIKPDISTGESLTPAPSNLSQMETPRGTVDVFRTPGVSEGRQQEIYNSILSEVDKNKGALVSVGEAEAFLTRRGLTDQLNHLRNFVEAGKNGEFFGMDYASLQSGRNDIAARMAAPSAIEIREISPEREVAVLRLQYPKDDLAVKNHLIQAIRSYGGNVDAQQFLAKNGKNMVKLPTQLKALAQQLRDVSNGDALTHVYLHSSNFGESTVKGDAKSRSYRLDTLQKSSLTGQKITVPEGMSHENYIEQGFKALQDAVNSGDVGLSKEASNLINALQRGKMSKQGLAALKKRLQGMSDQLPQICKILGLEA